MLSQFLNWKHELDNSLEKSNSIILATFLENGTLLYANQLMHKLLKGLTTEAFINPTFQQLLEFPQRQGPIFEGYLTLGNSTDDNSSIMAQVFKKDGALFISGGIDIAQLISQNKMMNTLNREVTNLQRNLIYEQLKLERTLKNLEVANAELRQLNITKDKFFSIIAHDLRSPFLGFLGITELFADKESKFTQDEFFGYANALFKSAKSIYSLLENLLAWSSMQGGKIEYIPQFIDLEPVVRTIVEQVSVFAKQKEIVLLSEIQESELVYADANMVNTVLRNLITNAIKFTQHKGTVYISTRHDENFVTVAVKDDGKGISIENQTKLFRLDTKFNSLGTDGEPSTGLGLILCKEFVEKNGGRIWIESEEGRGSIFSFTLPKE